MDRCHPVYKNIVKLGLFSLFLALSSLVSISCCVGTLRCYFSGLSWITPLFALATGSQALGLVGLLFAVKYLFFKRPLSLGIPTALATYSYRQSSCYTGSLADYAVNLFFPVAAMITFVAFHGYSCASLYALYWMIPIALFGARQRALAHEPWAYALTSSFVAHAAGSLIWLFFVPMTAEQWFYLIPVVAVERMVMHCGQVLLIKSYTACSARITSAYKCATVSSSV